MAEPVKVGVIGLGRSGWDLHIAGINSFANFELAAVADPESARRDEAQSKFGCETFASPEELIEKSDAELIVVATPSHTHAPLSIAALEAGKHVLCEKPMAVNLAEADAMCQAAARSGKILTIYQVRRFDPEVLKLQEILQSEKLGPLHLVRFGAYNFSRRRDWQTLKKFGGGQLNNWGAHLVDQALILSGGVWNELFADLKHTVTAGDADDHVKIVFKGAQNVTYDIEITTACAFSLPRVVVMGKYGSLILRDGKTMEIKYYDPAALPQDVRADEGPAANRSYVIDETIPWQQEQVEIGSGDARLLFYDKLYATLREGAPLAVTPEQVRNQMALFEAAHRIAGI
jgi:scyllo-inositol 2-dehydrogenase (NADP+)